MRMKLRQPTIAILKCPPDKERIYFWDASLPGFGVVAFPSGKKAYVAQYRNDDEGSRRKTIGAVESIGLAEARVKAKVLLDGAKKRTRRRRAFRLETTRLERPVMDHRAVVSLRLHRKLLSKIDKWAADHSYAAPGGLSRSAAIRMLLDHALEMDGRYLPGGLRVRLVIEGDDVQRKTCASTAYGPNGSSRKAANDKQAAAKLADKYISRDGASKRKATQR
jgi:hypothetical protein